MVSLATILARALPTYVTTFPFFSVARRHSTGGGKFSQFSQHHYKLTRPSGEGAVAPRGPR